MGSIMGTLQNISHVSNNDSVLIRPDEVSYALEKLAVNKVALTQ